MLGTIIALVAMALSAAVGGIVEPFSYGPTTAYSNSRTIPRNEIAGVAVIAASEHETRVPRAALAMSEHVERYMPVMGVRLDSVEDSWGAPRSGRRHEGQDILAPRGTRVYAASPGTVIEAGVDPLGGNVVVVLGDDGYEYYYAHLDRFAEGIGPGTRVTHTTLLGYVGSSGNADRDEPHLHFGVYTPQGAINPLPLLRDRF